MPSVDRAGAGRRSRLRALKLLFQADLRNQDPRDVLTALVDDPAAAALLDDDDLDLPEGDDPRDDGRALADDAHAQALVTGVAEHRDDLDRMIEELAVRWTVARMPLVDRNVLRLAAYELLHGDLPAGIVMDEAVEIAKALSTDKSGRFVNGVLAGIRNRHASTPTTD